HTSPRGYLKRSTKGPASLTLPTALGTDADGARRRARIDAGARRRARIDGGTADRRVRTLRDPSPRGARVRLRCRDRLCAPGARSRNGGGLHVSGGGSGPRILRGAGSADTHRV